jgi:hypothetical protein
MTSFWRTLVLVLAGLGATWAVTRVGDGPPTVFDRLDDAAPTAAPAATPPASPTPGAAGPADGPVPPPPADAAPPTDAEVEAQIRAAEEALGERADPNRELPVDPLRADVAISLPSDI